MIALQYLHKRARFQVVWIATQEGSQEEHLGAECVEPEKGIWGVKFPEKIHQHEEMD